MKTYFRTVILLLIVALLLLLLSAGLSSCGSSAEVFLAAEKADSEWSRYEFFSDEFTYWKFVGGEHPHYARQKAFRISKRNKETGEITYVCVDPVCTHLPEDGCPLVNEKRAYHIVAVTGDNLVYTSEFSTVLGVYNLITGKHTSLASSDGLDMTRYALSNGSIYYIKPDLVEKKTVYEMDSYDPDSEKIRKIAVFDKEYSIRAVTNKRIYLYEFANMYGKHLSECESFSVDLKGKNRREEPLFNFNPNYYEGSVCWGPAYIDYTAPWGAKLQMYAGYYWKYDLSTRERERIPAEDGAEFFGLWGDRYVWATCPDYEYAVSLSIETYAARHGLDPVSFVETDPDPQLKVSQERDSILFGGKVVIRSSERDGSDQKTLFELPEACCITSGVVKGDVVEMWLEHFVKTEDGQTRRIAEQCRFNLLSGEFEEAPPEYHLGDPPDPDGDTYDKETNSYIPISEWREKHQE